jgi:uncharacterized protein
LAERGHEVYRLVRREPVSEWESRWDPAGGILDENVLSGVNAVVNLCGLGVFSRPWTTSRRAELTSSRVDPGRTLAVALSRREDPPALLQASGIGRYGTGRADVPHTEDSPAADDFISGLVEDWEGSVQPAIEAGVRVVFLRTAPVLGRYGGAFPPMRRAWSLGLGAKLGDGSQRMPLIALQDYLAAVQWLAEPGSAEQADASGPYNLTIPEPATNAEFTAALAEALHRPRFLRAPAAPMRLVLGELAEQLVGDNWSIPQRLTDSGFQFAAPDVRSAITAALR